MMLSRFRPAAGSMRSAFAHNKRVTRIRPLSTKMQPSSNDDHHHDRPFIVSELIAFEIQRWKIKRDLKKEILKATNQAEMKRHIKFEQELHEFDPIQDDKKNNEDEIEGRW